MEDDVLDIKELKFGCALCGEVVEPDEMLGLTLFPSNDPEAFQQWFVHALCAKGMLLPTYTATARDELAELWE